jgi:hypothetical protein
MRREFFIVVLSMLGGCYFRTPTYDNSELDDARDGADAHAQDAQVEFDADALDAGSDDADAGCACSAPTPKCLPETNRCVACLGDGDCAGGSFCLPATGQCVECLNASHCASRPSASLCDSETQRCVPCRTGMDADCASVSGLNVCNGGTCVQCAADRRTACGEDKAACSGQFMCSACSVDADCQRFGKVCDEANGRCVGCTLDSEKAQCGKKSCNPATKQCTQTDRESVPLCNKCVADSECEAEHRCVELSYAGSSRGGYCLRRAALCTPPFQAPPIRRASLSGAPAEDYCGIAEQRTTCEAVLALQAAQTCTDATQCNAPGAICASVNRGGNLCTYACDTNVECPSSAPCAGSGSDKYCGR